jgi:hypothetical protein
VPLWTETACRFPPKPPAGLNRNRLSETPKFAPKAHKDPNRWDFDGFIKVASSFGLIKAETEKQADLAREFRNLIHPGRSTRLAKVCDRGTALSALAAVELIVRDLS